MYVCTYLSDAHCSQARLSDLVQTHADHRREHVLLQSHTQTVRGVDRIGQVRLGRVGRVSHHDAVADGVALTRQREVCVFGQHGHEDVGRPGEGHLQPTVCPYIAMRRWNPANLT